MRAWLIASLGVLAAVVGACAADVNDTGGDDDDDGEGGEGGAGGAGGGGQGGGQAGGPVACTSADQCAAFNDVCSAGICENGQCVKKPANEFGACDDGLHCSENDVCQMGACVGGNTLFCPSQDSCHLGVCDEDLDTCKNVAGNDGAQCDDMDPCTVVGTCNGGVCSKGAQVNCSLFNGPCTTGVCDPMTGCKPVPANEGQFCDDGQGSPCSAGECTSGTCLSQSANEGGGCNDNLYCTINDKCQAGNCVGEPNTCAPPGDVCMIGTCNENAKTCVAVPGNNGNPCDDGNFCSSGEACSNGVCLGGVPANDGIACDDSNGCTGGTTCLGGVCRNSTSEITQCVDGDTCCPAGCPADKDCLYWVPGVQQNVNPVDLVGWTQCWTGTYDQSQPQLSQILQQCDKAKLLMACRPQGQQNFTLLAMAPRLDVLFDCGTQTNCTKQSNGVGFYYSDQWSWGFAPGGLGVNRSSCDYNDGVLGQQNLRMCWHTGGAAINSGYRCGDNDLNGGSTWDRFLFEAD